MFLLWSHGFSMCSLQISVLFVIMRVEISLFSSGILGSCGVFLLVKPFCVIQRVYVAMLLSEFWYARFFQLVDHLLEAVFCSVGPLSPYDIGPSFPFSS